MLDAPGPLSDCTSPGLRRLSLIPLAANKDLQVSPVLCSFLSAVVGEGGGRGAGGRQHRAQAADRSWHLGQPLLHPVLSLLEGRNPPGVSLSCLLVSPFPSGLSAAPTSLLC